LLKPPSPHSFPHSDSYFQVGTHRFVGHHAQ
jgi:hypothetical protein